MLFNTAVAALSLSSVVVAQVGPAVSSSVYNNIVTYSGYAAAAYANQCGSPLNGSSVVKYYSDATTDTQATLFLAKKAKQIIIAFRGTSTPADFNTDFKFLFASPSGQGINCPGKCQVHAGFQGAWLSVQSAVLADIKSLQQSNPSYSLVVTGHSLGGGIAAIASASLAAIGNKNLNVYTYGEPRNGNADWGTYIATLIPNANYYRVTHSNDGVPRLPPTLLGYVHHGTEYWQKPDTGITAANTFQCPGVQNNNCNQGTTYGSNPINGAHISYSNGVIGNSLYIAACGNAPQQVI